MLGTATAAMCVFSWPQSQFCDVDVFVEVQHVLINGPFSPRLG